MPPRGCGKTRQENGLYAMTLVGEGGIPWWKCLVDPIVPVDCGRIGLAPEAVVMLPRKTRDGREVYDMWDWIGAGAHPHAQGYWNVTDFIEEGLRFNFSGRIPANPAVLSKIGPGTVRALVHPHAHVLNAPQQWVTRKWQQCKTVKREHEETKEADWLCASFLWEMVEGGRPMVEGGRVVERDMPGFTYVAMAPGIPLRYAPGLFMKLPITHFEVVRGDKADEVAERVEKAKTGLNVKVVEE